MHGTVQVDSSLSYRALVSLHGCLSRSHFLLQLFFSLFISYFTGGIAFGSDGKSFSAGLNASEYNLLFLILLSHHFPNFLSCRIPSISQSPFPFFFPPSNFPITCFHFPVSPIHIPLTSFHFSPLLPHLSPIFQISIPFIHLAYLPLLLPFSHPSLLFPISLPFIHLFPIFLFLFHFPTPFSHFLVSLHFPESSSSAPPILHS